MQVILQELSGNGSGEKSKPHHSSKRSAAVDPAILIDFCERSTDTKRGRMRNKPTGAEDKIDDVVLTDENCDHDIRRGSSGDVGER